MKRALKILKWLAVAVACVLVGIQFMGPAKSNPAVDQSQTIHARLQVSPEVKAIFDRSCNDCHSSQTRWPWYSNVAPVSWFVIDHVNHGRRHFNYSDWAQYEPDVARRLLENSCDFARKETMPLPSYTRMHRGARLTDQDIAALCDWTGGVLREVRRR